MTEILLCKALRARFEVTLQDIHHPTDPSRGRDQEFKAPNIVNGFLPPKRKDTETDFPFVIVRPVEGDTEIEDGGRLQDVATIKLIVGSYGEEDDDYEYCLVILRRIINDLRTNRWIKDGAGNDQWKMRPQVKWKMTDEQATTVFFVEAMIRFDMPTQQESFEDVDLDD